MEQHETDIILDSISDGVFTVGKDWRISSFNRAAERITGIERADAEGQLCSYVFRASICEGGCALRKTMETGEPVTNLPIFIIRADGQKIPVSISTALLRDHTGTVVGGVETFRDLSMEEELKRELKSRASFEDMISRNHRMQELFALLPTIAGSAATVLVTGESGTGKELVCRAIHSQGPRAEGPFVTVNCTALPDTLLESELFGYKAGAFTDARTDREGLITRADSGTLLLDEIGDISPALQVKLLRFLQEKEYTPLGTNRAVHADVRVLAATNRDLLSMVESGSFRRDLYYRINVVTLELPPLRERREDIPLLIAHFIDHFNRLNGRAITGPTDAALAALINHDYPGNIRELENAIEHAFVLCREEHIRPEHLPFSFRTKPPVHSTEDGGSLRECEIAAIEQALRTTGYNRTSAARALGIHKSTLHRKINRYRLDIPDRDTK